VVFCKFSKLLNQEDALGAPCLRHFRKMSLPRPGAAFYKRWSGVSVRLFKGAFSFLSRISMPPVSGASEDLPVGDS
jgi:hypothetical protein